jgi:hypothetical protein
MAQERCTPNVIVYNVLIQGPWSNGILEKAMSVLTAMENTGLICPNERTYSIIIDGF